MLVLRDILVWIKLTTKAVKDIKKEKKKAIFNVLGVEWRFWGGVLESVCQRAVTSCQCSPTSSNQDLDSRQKKNCRVLCVQSLSFILEGLVSVTHFYCVALFCSFVSFAQSLFLFSSGQRTEKRENKFQTILFVKVSRLNVFILKRCCTEVPRPPPFFNPTSSDKQHTSVQPSVVTYRQHSD